MKSQTNSSVEIHQKILWLLEQGRFDQVVDLIGNLLAKKGWFNWFRSSKAQKFAFGYLVLNSCLRNEIDPENYFNKHKADFAGDLINDLHLLLQALLAMEKFEHRKTAETTLALTLTEIVRDGAVFIEKNSNSYPEHPIAAIHWRNGAGLRDIADELAKYFKRQENHEKELDGLFLRGKITTMIMGHYPQVVGPDMNAIARKYEELGQKEQARKFYAPVVADFIPLVEEIELCIGEPEQSNFEEDIVVTQALIDSLEGLKRLGDSIDEEKLLQSKQTATKIRQRVHGN